MRLTSERLGYRSRLEIAGELDFAASVLLRQALLRQLAAGVLNVDSAMVATLVEADERLRAAGGLLLLAGVPGCGLDILHLTRFGRRLRILENLLDPEAQRASA